MNNFRNVFFIAFIAFIVANVRVNGQIIRSYQVQVKGSVQVIRAYKGGAAPTEEILEYLKQPIPLANADLFLKKSFYSNKFYLLHTDSAGNFEFSIKPGVYNIYFTNENSAVKKHIEKNDLQSECEEQYKIQSHGTLRVYKKENLPLQITILERTDPCGPPPPLVSPKNN